MLNRFYFIMILKLLRKSIINEKKKLKIILNKNEEKIFLNFFFNLKTNIITSFVFFNNNSAKLLADYTLSSANMLKSKKNYDKNSLFFFQLKVNNLNYSLNKLDEIYNIYCNFFLKNNIYDSSLYNKFYFNLYLEKKKVLILSNFFLKKNFYKILKFLIDSSFLNLKPLLIADETINEGITVMTDYLKFLNKSDEYDYIFICNPFIKLKFISQLKKLNLPIFSIVDDQINQSWIDYPIYINKINNFSVYFFYCFFFQIHTFGQKLKKKYYGNLYKDFLVLNYSKEYILNSEIK